VLCYQRNKTKRSPINCASLPTHKIPLRYQSKLQELNQFIDPLLAQDFLFLHSQWISAPIKEVFSSTWSGKINTREYQLLVYFVIQNPKVLPLLMSTMLQVPLTMLVYEALLTDDEKIKEDLLIEDHANFYINSWMKTNENAVVIKDTWNSTLINRIVNENNRIPSELRFAFEDIFTEWSILKSHRFTQSNLLWSTHSSEFISLRTFVKANPILLSTVIKKMVHDNEVKFLYQATTNKDLQPGEDCNKYFDEWFSSDQRPRSIEKG